MAEQLYSVTDCLWRVVRTQRRRLGVSAFLLVLWTLGGPGAVGSVDAQPQTIHHGRAWFAAGAGAGFGRTVARPEWDLGRRFLRTCGRYSLEERPTGNRMDGLDTARYPEHGGTQPLRARSRSFSPNGHPTGRRNAGTRGLCSWFKHAPTCRNQDLAWASTLPEHNLDRNEHEQPKSTRRRSRTSHGSNCNLSPQRPGRSA